MLDRAKRNGKRRLLGVLGLSVAALGLASVAPGGGSGRATPATLTRVLASAEGGDTIILAPGDYGRVTLSRRRFARPVTLDARQARFEQLTVRGASGVVIAGGIVQSPPETLGVFIDGSDHVTVRDMTIGGALVGITLRRSTDVVVAGNRLLGVRSDGINIGMSQRVRVERNECRDFRPVPPVFDSRGKLVKDGDHPDCIQGWSRPGDAPTGDVTVIGNRAVGRMQGVFFNNYVRDGVDDGGYDRMVVRNNDLTLSMYNGVVLEAVRGAVVTGNIVRPEPGARNLWWPFRPVTPWIKLIGTDIRACGNAVAAGPGQKVSSGTQPCRN